MRSVNEPDHAISTALKVLRLTAGFPTAEAAAVHFKWKVSRYRAHESGTRRVLPADLAIYAEGFGVPMGQLARPQKRQVERMLADLGKRSDETAERVAKRLRCARVIRGYSSARQAAPIIGVKQTTFTKHESGRNAVSPDMIDFYASMLGISRAWLATGVLPTGLGNEIDQAIDRAMRHPEDFKSLADKSPVEILLVDDPLTLKPGRPPRRVFKMAEYLSSDIEKAAGNLKAIMPHGLVIMPAVVDQVTDRPAMFSIVVDKPFADIVKHSRLFVLSESDMVDGDYLFIHDHQLAIRHMVDGGWNRALAKASLGRIVGRLESFGRR